MSTWWHAVVEEQLGREWQKTPSYPAPSWLQLFTVPRQWQRVGYKRESTCFVKSYTEKQELWNESPILCKPYAAAAAVSMARRLPMAFVLFAIRKIWKRSSNHRYQQLLYQPHRLSLATQARCRVVLVAQQLLEQQPNLPFLPYLSQRQICPVPKK